MKPVSLLAAALAALTLGASQPKLERLWLLEGLKAPESVALSRDGTFLYVSNVNGDGEARDGNGFIARVSLDGKVIELEWAKGLDAPKGLALKGDRLFAADLDKLVEMDARTGARVRGYPAPGAKFLNDAAIAPDGRVLASDSVTGRIYALEGGKVTLWSEAPELKAINGLLPEKDRLVITTMAGLLLAMDWKTRAITVLARGLGNADGVAPAGEGAYYVSEWPGRLFLVRADGSAETLSDGRASETYINDFLRVGDRLYLPHWSPGSLEALRISSRGA